MISYEHAAQELDERIAQELKEQYTKLADEGKLTPREQLTNYYALFRRRFGPDRLKSLDGEALLKTMHSHGTKESMVYWLEFKDDDEFSSPKLGSIAGGSAHKFGIFRKQDTGQWIAGSPQKEQILTLEQAIEKARTHRDELVQGAELLEQFPSGGSDADYARLQQDMERVAPNVNDSAWGHKYFSLLFPEILDDFHSPDYQHFHLLKLLQLPPQGKGRYLAAGRFVAIARSLAIPVNNLTVVLNNRDGRNPSSYWSVGTKAGNSEDFWPMMRDNNCVAIGWHESGDLTNITKDVKGKEAIKDILLSQNINPIAAGKAAQQLFHARWTIAPGDLVLASNGATVLGVGKVSGEYSYEPASDFPHRLPVEWLSLEEWHQLDVEGLQTTVYRMKKDMNLLEAERHIAKRQTHEPVPPLPSPSPTGGNNSPAPESSSLPSLQTIPARIQAILGRKGQVILYGPPGTGKTYWAENAACEFAARANFNKTFEQLTDEQRTSIVGTNGTVRLCSFHPAYGYEDFLEGFRPEPINGQMHFTLRDGIFKKLCDDAQAKPDLKFYLIIDEINRGDIPRIFGELLAVLEKNKRGKAVLLPLTGEPFSVPNNVYIIGTMNTADRSIALLDTALRRRFGFLELMPDIDVLGDIVVDGIPLGPWLAALNKRIFEHVGRDARNLQLGHSYLFEGGSPVDNFTTFVRIVQEDIFPLLEEYCQELLISQLLSEINELVARGLQRKYVRTEDSLASPRGKINIQRLANQGGTLQATLPCTYHPRLEDCLVNQVLLQGLLLAARLTNNSTLRIQLYRLARSFQENVSSIQLDHHVFKQLGREMNRLIAAYKPAITLTELLFAAKGIALDEEPLEMQLPGFLFDMNLFFQALLSRFLKEHLPGYVVQDQYKILNMMSYDPAHNPRKRKAPKPRPDYVILQKTNVVAILDAKYRDLWENTLPEHILYQLAMYALSQPEAMEAVILYPTMHADAQEARILIHDPIYATNRASVVLRPVNLIELDKLVTGKTTIDTMRKQAACAEWLAFGKVNAISVL